MTKPKTWADLARSPDADWSPRQPATLMEMVAELARSIGTSTTGVTVSGYDASDPDARRMFECLLAYAKREAVQA